MLHSLFVNRLARRRRGTAARRDFCAPSNVPSAIESLRVEEHLVLVGVALAITEIRSNRRDRYYKLSCVTLIIGSVMAATMAN
jgi:hypothetical protein